MDLYYTLIIGFLFLLAISLLIIGVSNDAVNFLNSAIGSKAASFNVILAIAAVGVLVGAVFSNGMMEVARKGIFNPEFFAFNEIMVIFLSVMLTNILLLDFFNTFGLPTSTTISIVFSLLGGAVAVSVYKILQDDSHLHYIGEYINIESSVLIIVGIFMSVAIAFSIGSIIMWLVRLAFSFNLKKTYKYWTGIWGGFAITTILYFLIIKGAKGSTLVSPELLSFIKEQTSIILLISFVGWTILFQILTLFTKVNILKITVLVGTFALAMAFAGNDLVNFIGVPLAGLESFKAFSASGATDANTYMMEALHEPVNTPIFFLITAGLIMVLTLRFSKKSKAVTATTIDLSRQDEGTERFASSYLARFIVRRSLELSQGIAKIIPPVISNFVKSRFDVDKAWLEKDEKIAFDLVRASVNLVVASILIAIGTSLKLPLSTTYVTFMVAMGTSLADGAWGRDSAVYRITGVLTVIGGWFFTAFIAFLASLIIATLIYFGKLLAIIILIGISAYTLLRTQMLYKKRTAKEKENNKNTLSVSHEILKSCDNEVKCATIKVSKLLYLTYLNFYKEKHKELKNLKKETKKLTNDIKHIREDIPNTLKKFEETDLLTGHHYVQIVTYMKEMCNSLTHTIEPAFEHLDNNHSFDKKETEELKDFNNSISEYFNFAISILENREDEKVEELICRREALINLVNDILLTRIKVQKKNKKMAKVSLTYIEMLSETKNIIVNLVQLVKADLKLMESSSPEE